jgi:phage anti-repressor protein
MFNRVGNLTVLSLSKRRNAVIENLHAFKNRSKTWAERLIRKAQEKDSQDYAAVRIYWKYPDQSGNQKYKVP